MTSHPPRDSAPLASPPSQPIPSSALLRGGNAVVIEHGGSLYTLRLTRQGKLILTK